MKIINYWVILTGSAVVLTSSGRSFAQTQLTRDGYAVTPKILQMTENGGTAEPAMGGGEIIMGESPGAKVVVGPSGRRVVFAPSYYEIQDIGYRTTWDDGVAASPRLRQTMMENKYATPAMGGSQYIGEESTPGKVTVTPQGQRVWVESHPGTGVSTTYDNRPPRVGYARSFDFGIAAPPRAWKMMIENPANREMFALR